jgi:hypothetical protein
VLCRLLPADHLSLHCVLLQVGLRLFYLFIPLVSSQLLRSAVA